MSRLFSFCSELGGNGAHSLVPIGSRETRTRNGKGTSQILLEEIIMSFFSPKRRATRSDPNRADDPEYIIHLIGQVVRVSVETVHLVAALPESYSG